MRRGFAFYALVSFVAICFIELASAYWGYGYLPQPQDLLNSNWLKFALFFLLFYALVFFSVSRLFGKSNKSVGIVISLVVAFSITAAFAQQGLFDGYMGDNLSNWLIFIGSLILLAFCFKWFYEHLSKIGAYVLLFVGWIVLHFTDPIDILPYVILDSPFMPVYDFLRSWFGLLILVIVSTLSILKKKNVVLHHS